MEPLGAEEQERQVQQQAKLRQVLQAMKEERLQDEATINELQTSLDSERARSEDLEGKVLRLVDMVKLERKKAQNIELERKKAQDLELQRGEASAEKNQEREKELEDQLGVMTRRVEELERQLREKEDANQQQQQQQQSSSLEVEQLQGQVKELQANLDHLQPLLNRQLAQLATAQDLVQSQKDELKKAKLNSDQLSTELDRNTVEKKEVQTQYDKLKAELSSIKLELNNSSNENNSLAILQSENERLKQELDEAVEKANDSQSLADEASNRADTFETKLATLIQVLKDLKSERANWIQREAELQQQVETLTQNATTNKATSESVAPTNSGVDIDQPEFKELQHKLHTMETEITKLKSISVELKQELVSATNKYNLSESTCDKLRDEIEKLQTQAKQPTQASPPPPPPPAAPNGAPMLPPPPPPPPAFKKLSDKLEIKKSAKKPPQEGGKGGNEGDALKTKLMEEISKGVTLRKVQPSQAKPSQPADNDNNNNMFSLGAMASMLAKKRMARISMRIDADDPMKGALDSLLAEVNNK